MILSVFLLLSGVLSLRMLGRERTGYETQYERLSKLIYPRGLITDRFGIAFNSSEEASYQINTAYPRAAAQVVGQVEINEEDTAGSGVIALSGINALYDDILRGGSAISVYSSVDAEGRVLENEEQSVSGDHSDWGGTVALTLDYVLQSEFEKIMSGIRDERGYRALCAVLSEVDTGAILAMATVGSEMNMNVLSYPPGSVMKVITSAAALKAGVLDPADRYDCTSEVAVGTQTRYCSERIAHGEMSYAEAFSHSCNCAFFELTRSLCTNNPDGTISCAALELAREWGFSEYGMPSGEDFILHYQNHYSFVPKYLYNEMDIFNAALGQGNIQASPYLLNKLMAAIAHGGECVTPYIVERVSDSVGNEIYRHEADSERFSLGLSEDAVSALQEMLALTGKSGSAAANSLGDAGGLSAKTGTAEHGEGGECHSWLCGYFPSEEPKYAMTVFIEQGGPAPQNALYVYDQLAGCALDILGD